MIKIRLWNFFYFHVQNELSTFLPSIFFKACNTVYNKHGQVLTNIKRCLLRIFSGTRRQKILSKIRDTPTPMYKFCRYQKLSEKSKGPLTIFFLWQEKFSTSCFLYLLYGLPKISRPTNRQLQNFSETLKTFHRQKNCVQKLWHVIPLSKLFNSTNFQRHQRAPCESFWNCGTKNLIFVILPSMVYQKFRSRQIVNAISFQKHPELFQDNKISCKNRDAPLCLKFVDTRNFQKHPMVPLRFSSQCDKKILWKLW